MKRLTDLLKRAVKAIVSDRQLTLGVIAVLALLFIVAFAPYITSFDPYDYGPDSKAPPMINGHILGTNDLGQDVFAMVIYGTRTSLRVALISGLISGAIGVFAGGLAGYFGGLPDKIISEIINVFMMIPSLFLILLIIALFGNSIYNVMLVIGLTTWPSNAKLMRAQAMSLRQRTFVSSAAAIGEGRLRILLKYIIPNGIFPVVANTTLGMANAILFEASLGFLGLGDVSVISWGQMVQSGKNYITTAWWVATFGGAAMVFAILALNLLGDGLNHALDPKYGGGR
jgi:peptide/nickel transport system permease protein